MFDKILNKPEPKYYLCYPTVPEPECYLWYSSPPKPEYYLCYPAGTSKARCVEPADDKAELDTQERKGPMPCVEFELAISENTWLKL
jgi:hypothetical protein